MHNLAVNINFMQKTAPKPNLLATVGYRITAYADAYATIY